MISKTLMAASTRPIILAILTRGEDYGYSIIQKVKNISGGNLEWTDGMLYPVLQRMEMDDLIASKWKLSGGNRPRRYYTITEKGRKELAELTGAGAERILDWVNRADLYRIKGASEEYSDLLEAAGVDTIVELAQRNAENLHTKMEEVNAKKKLVRRLPTAAQVSDWVRQAKDLPRKVSY